MNAETDGSSEPEGAVGAALATPLPKGAPSSSARGTLADQRRELFASMRRELGVEELQMQQIEAIFARSPVLGQGNPALTEHPMTREECRKIRADAGVAPTPPNHCGAANMVPVFDPAAGQGPRQASLCIDQYEFPNIACEYPVVFVTAQESALLCRALGKRLCDAHEWEGACAGALHPPEVEYAFGKGRMKARELHNRGREILWSYGTTKDHARCGTGSARTPGCRGGFYHRCGSNTYPAGAFPACKSPFGAFDLHGNAAEHMSLPLDPAELGRLGGTGATEMKGSWFIFSTYEAHPDDCRWRAPDWHGSKVMDLFSHLNYHLGFRCCKDVTPP
jgi:sulfatase modifying factor 1